MKVKQCDAKYCFMYNENVMHIVIFNYGHISYHTHTSLNGK
jgi:hypothetical protein